MNKKIIKILMMIAILILIFIPVYNSASMTAKAELYKDEYTAAITSQILQDNPNAFKICIGGLRYIFNLDNYNIGLVINFMFNTTETNYVRGYTILLNNFASDLSYFELAEFFYGSFSPYNNYGTTLASSVIFKDGTFYYLGTGNYLIYNNSVYINALNNETYTREDMNLAKAYLQLEQNNDFIETLNMSAIDKISDYDRRERISNTVNGGVPLYHNYDLSNCCGAVAGTIAVAYYDQYCENLITDFEPLTNLYYRDIDYTKVNSLCETLATAMNLNDWGPNLPGVTPANFKSGLQSFVNSKGYQVSYTDLKNSGQIDFSLVQDTTLSDDLFMICCTAYCVREDYEQYFEIMNTPHWFVGYGYRNTIYYKTVTEYRLVYRPLYGWIPRWVKEAYQVEREVDREQLIRVSTTWGTAGYVSDPGTIIDSFAISIY